VNTAASSESKFGQTSDIALHQAREGLLAVRRQPRIQPNPEHFDRFLELAENLVDSAVLDAWPSLRDNWCARF
jgi:hypothetical protein